MLNKLKRCISCLFIFFIASCTISREVTILTPMDITDKNICVIQNSNIRYDKFNDVLIKELEKKGYNPKLVQTEENCDLYLKFNAEWQWDMAYYLTDVDFNLYKTNKHVASAKYHVAGGSGNMLLWYKYRRSQTIISSLLDMLETELTKQ